MMNWLRLLTVSVSFAFLAACGGGSAESSSATTPASSERSTALAAPAAGSSNSIARTAQTADVTPPAEATQAQAAHRPTVFGIVAATPQLSTLEVALREAGLVSTLRGDGPFTLFAPSNKAFDALLAELGITIEELLANKPRLTAILTYHVLASRVLAGAIVDDATAITLQGQAITFDKQRVDDALDIDLIDAQAREANVIFPNLRASNGVVHVIDRVILPQPLNVVELALSNPDFSFLVEALTAADLVETLSGPGPFTVFAPTNAAFDALLIELGITKEELLADKPLLTNVLTYHVLTAAVLAADVPVDQAIVTLQGSSFVVDAGFVITDAQDRTSNIVATNLQGINGVIHTIDRVLLPQAPK
jgi:transforming growth factor-beta-induced protein